MDDEKIVELYFDRNQKAIEETEHKFGKYLYKIAFNILSDRYDSEESVNDTYMKAWNTIPPNKPTVLSVYLGRLTRSISIDVFRKKSAAKRKGSQYALSVHELGDCIADKKDIAEDLEVKALAKAISDFLRTLPEDSRRLFIGRYYFMESLKDAAKYCKMSESKAKSRLFRIRCSLKDYLVKEGYYI